MKFLFFFFFLLALLSTQMSQATRSGVTEAPTLAPTTIDFITVMYKQGCEAFANLLRLSKLALSIYNDNIDRGLTVFCPTDASVKSFADEYKNLTDAQKVSLLLYHSVPFYLAVDINKYKNDHMSTLATVGPNKFKLAVENHGENVILKTKVNTASVVGLLADQVPFMVFRISQVLMPRELFKGKYSGAADAPADGPVADGPADGPVADGPADGPAADALADGPEAYDPTDDDGTENGMSRLDEGNRVNGFLRFFRFVA